MYKNTASQFTFDTDLILTACEYPSSGYWKELRLNQFVGQNIDYIKDNILEEFSEIIGRLKEMMLSTREAPHFCYHEFFLHLGKEPLIVMALVTNDHGIFKTSCMFVDEKMVLSNHHLYFTRMLSNVLNNTPIGVTVRRYDENMQSDFFMANEKFYQLFNLKDESQNGLTQWNDEEDVNLDTQNDSGTTQTFEKHIHKDDGTISKWLYVTKQRTERSHNTFEVITTYTDITEQKEKEVAAINSLKTIHLLAKATKVLVFSYNQNKGTIDIFGGEGHDVFSRLTNDEEEYKNITHPDDREAVRQCIERFYNSNDEKFVYEARQMDSSTKSYRHYRIVGCRMINAEGEHITLGIRQDIESEFQQQKEHMELTDMNAALLKNIPIGVEIYDADGNLTYINDKALELVGLKREDVPPGINIYQNMFMPDEVKQNTLLQKDFTSVLCYDFDDLSQNHNVKTSMRGVHYFDFTFSPIFTREGTFNGYMSTGVDTTESHSKSKRLEELSNNLDLVFQAANMSAWIYYPDRKLFTTLKGNTLVGSGMSDTEIQQHIHPNDQSDLYHLFYDFINLTREQAVTQFRFRKDGGEYRYYESCMRPNVVNGKLISITGTEKDVTNEVTQKQKMDLLSSNLELALKAGNVSAWIYYPEKRWFETIKGDSLIGKGMDAMEIMHHIEPLDSIHLLKLATELINFKRDEAQAVFRKKDENGVMHYYQTNARPNVVNGKVISITGTERDITESINSEQKLKEMMTHLQNKNTMLRNVVDNLPCTLTIKDATDGYKYVMANKQFCETLNKPFEELLGKTLLATFNDNNSDRYAFLDHQAVERMEQITFEDSVDILGKHYEWQVSHIPLKMEDGHVYVMGIYTDISNFKKANIDLQKAKEKAEQADKLKSAFLANMSHEIRTPLNAIVGFTDLMIHTDQQEEKEEYLGIVRENTNILLQIINDILDLSKIESGTLVMHPSNTDVIQIISNALKSVTPLLEGKDIKTQIDNHYSSCHAMIDGSRFAQIINNYVSNAAKYTQQGSISVGIQYINGMLTVNVRDTGEGIAKNHQNLIFGRFNKLNSFVQGTGLGLSICKAIAELMNGEAGFESEEGIGSNFWVKIPCEASIGTNNLAEKNASGLSLFDNSYTPEQHSEKKRILVAEDKESNYLLLQKYLKDYELKRAVNGSEAVRFLRKETFDLILMDVMMPKMDGLEATRIIRQNHITTPIVALTASAYDSDKQKAIEAGCDDYLSKPIRKDLLMKLVDKVFSEEHQNKMHEEGNDGNPKFIFHEDEPIM